MAISPPALAYGLGGKRPGFCHEHVILVSKFAALPMQLWGPRYLFPPAPCEMGSGLDYIPLASNRSMCSIYEEDLLSPS